MGEARGCFAFFARKRESKSLQEKIYSTSLPYEGRARERSNQGIVDF
jgi:hypothetical protein